MTKQATTRDRILSAAKDLFYREGIRSVGIEAIVQRAEITKPTLYYYFKSKDDLVVAYLDQRKDALLASVTKTMDSVTGSVAERIAAVFTSVARETPNPRWKGCPIVRGAAEFAADPDHGVRQLASAHKKQVEELFEQALHAEKISNAKRKARQLAILLDGAITHAFMHGDPDYAQAAGEAVKPLVGK
jgi:AcrR family transcriptional regulator